MSKDREVEKLRREMREHGARVAYEALIGVCQDPKAAAPAKSAAGAAILRAAGFMEKADAPGDDDEPASAAQLEETIARLKEHEAALDAAKAAKDADAEAEKPAAVRKGRRKDEGGLFD